MQISTSPGCDKFSFGFTVKFQFQNICCRTNLYLFKVTKEAVEKGVKNMFKVNNKNTGIP